MLDYQKFPDYDQHELVISLDDPSSGLNGFVAIHNTNLGPALGGTRVFPYASQEEALRDALRLSRAMTYKCAIAKLPYGGGKAVIILDPKNKTEQVLRSYAEYIEKLGGRFYTGEDVGLSEADVEFMLGFSGYFIGKPGQAGDPSVYAALSVYYCMQAALQFVFGVENFVGRKVAIRGLGKTGAELLRLLVAAGAEVFAADSNAEVLQRIQQQYPQIKVVDPKEIAKQQVDIYAPCALGDEFNAENIQRIQAKIICGTANNQLETPEVGKMLLQKGIAYVPDYVANSGGLINVADELEQGGYDKDRVLKRIADMKDVCMEVLKISSAEKLSTNEVADKMAENFIKEKLISVSNA